MDLRMPRMDGFEATRLITQKHGWIQVVILNFYDDLLPDRSPAEVGAFAYLVKGCSPSPMRDVIFKAWRVALQVAVVPRPGAPIAPPYLRKSESAAANPLLPTCGPRAAAPRPAWTVGG